MKLSDCTKINTLKNEYPEYVMETITLKSGMKIEWFTFYENGLAVIEGFINPLTNRFVKMRDYLADD